MPPRKKTTTKRKAAPAAKRRQGFLAIALPWLKRFGFGLGAILLSGWLIAWFIITGAADRTKIWIDEQIITASADAGLTIQNMLVEGRTYTDPQLITALLNIQTGDPLLSIQPQEAKSLLESTKWVKHAYVQRRMPDTLYIKLVERTPIARLKTKNDITLLDQDSLAIEIDESTPEHLNDLILLSGAGADAHALHFIRTVQATPDLYKQAKSAARIGNRRWDLTLHNGITLKLPEDNNMGYALKRIETADQDDGILNRTEIKSIDLRFDNKLVIETIPGGIIDYQHNLSDKKKKHSI